MKTSKIATLGEPRKWDGPNGTVYYFNITFENDDHGSIGAKSETAYKVGEELTYTIEQTEKGNKIKKVQQFGGNGRSSGSPASFALSYAKDLAVANLNVTGSPIEMDKLADKIIATADKFQKWLKENQ